MDPTWFCDDVLYINNRIKLISQFQHCVKRQSLEYAAFWLLVANVRVLS
jgi:hypothetical protein